MHSSCSRCESGNRGDPRGGRTLDLRVKNPLLYPLSYRTEESPARERAHGHRVMLGASGRSRTADAHGFNVALYLLSYRGGCFGSCPVMPTLARFGTPGHTKRSRPAAVELEPAITRDSVARRSCECSGRDMASDDFAR